MQSTNSTNNQSHASSAAYECATEILQTTYGYQNFRLNQSDIIRALLDNRDVMALMPTGGGKSLCYQIPSLVRDGTGVIVSPLIALMQDQVNSLKQLGVRAAFLNSTLTTEQVQKTEQALRDGQLDMVYIAPERLLTERTLNLLDSVRIALFAIDEAHCVSQWGHDFRKEYQQLSILYQRYPQVPRIALTATADKRTRNEIQQQLNLQNAAVYINSFDRPNIRYTINDGQNQRDQLWRFIQNEHKDDAGIVYCLSRKKVESVADWLTEKGCTALPYHAGLPDELRRQHQEKFLREDSVIIVATIAFGMGIDKPDVRFVAHLNLPKSIEAYYQETGRAGRDGEPANAWMNYGLQDVITLRQWNQQADASEHYKRVTHSKLEAILGLCELTSCRRQSLLAYFDEIQEQVCGNCDNCLQPPHTWDATVAVQKLLSCIYRTEQRFGAGYIIDVLTGKTDERIQRNGHDKLSTFNIGNDLGNAEWRSVIRQLIAQNFLESDMEGHGSLKLTEQCRPLLRGEQNIELRKITQQEKQKQKSHNKTSNLRACDVTLYEALRSLRLRLANEQGVPAYVIFHDQTLQDMARLRPEDETALRYINGVGERKLERYGQAFLEEIKAHPLPRLLNNSLNETTNETLLLYMQGNDAEAIARQRDLKVSTIYTHFADAIAADLIDAREILPIDNAQFNEIINTFELLDIRETSSLKPAYEAMEQAYDYGILKCVLASNFKTRIM